ncbi:MAG: hypothetical protein ACR2NW_08535 [Thermodesulfobacteriota bacterium]
MQNVLVYLIILLSLNTGITFSQTFEDFVRFGDEYHSKFENLKALEEYKKAYHLNPDNFLILKKLTLTSNDCGEDLRGTDMEKAKNYFRESVSYAELAKEKFPDEPDVYFLLAISYGNLSRYTGGKDKVKLARNVEENLQKTIKYKPDFAPAYIAMGIYYREVANLSWLLKKFAKAFLGGLTDGTLEESKIMLLKALELRPDFIITHYEIGKTYLDLKEPEKAEFHFQKVLDLEIVDHSDWSKKEKVKKMKEENKIN